MSRDELKKVTAEVSKDCWKALRIIAVQKELALHAVVAEVLEKSMKKHMTTNTNNNVAAEKE